MTQSRNGSSAAIPESQLVRLPAWAGSCPEDEPGVSLAGLILDFVKARKSVTPAR